MKKILILLLLFPVVLLAQVRQHRSYQGDAANSGHFSDIGPVADSLVVLWSVDLHLLTPPMGGPIVGSDSLIRLPTAAGIYVFDLQGIKVDSFLTAPVTGTPVVTDSNETIFATVTGQVYCLAANMSLLWVDSLDGPVNCSVTAYDTTVLVTTTSSDSRLYALNLLNGDISWNSSLLGGGLAMATPGVWPQALGGYLVYVTSLNQLPFIADVIVWGFDQAGTEILQDYVGFGDLTQPRMPMTIGPQSELIWGQAYQSVFRQGRLFVRNNNGSAKWSKGGLKTFHAAPAVSSNYVYAPTGDGLKVYNLNSGAVVASYEVGSINFSAPLYNNNEVVFGGTNEGGVYRLQNGNTAILSLPDADTLTTGCLFDSVMYIASFNGHLYALGSVKRDTIVTAIEIVEETHASRFALAQNSPNPFNSETLIAFTLPQAGHVSLAIYDITGRKIASLVNGQLSASKHEYLFDSRNLASGYYFLRLQTDQVVATRKMVLLK